MPKIYYCSNCNLFLENEGFRFQNIKTKPSRNCPLCKNKYRVFIVKNTNWMKIRISICIIIGMLYYILLTSLFYYDQLPSYNLAFLIGIIFVPYALTMWLIYDISNKNIKLIIERLKQDKSELVNKNALFERKSKHYSGNKDWHVVIYENGIELYCYSINEYNIANLKNGKIELIPSNNILGLYRYNNGFHLDIRNNKIGIINCSFSGRDYIRICKALKTCLKNNWDKIYHEKILKKGEIFTYQS